MNRNFSLLVALGALVVIGQGCVIPDMTSESPDTGLVKASGPAVYYRSGDGTRYVFPNEKVYFSWYPDFSNIRAVSDEELADMPIGGTVTYKPGTRLVKITTDPKVYAVGAGGLLRWVTSESLAKALYGSAWAKNVHDIPDAFFADYRTGNPIMSAEDYHPDDPYYHSLKVGGDRASIDASELPDDLSVYPSGTLTGIMKFDEGDIGSSPVGESASVMYGYALQDVADASSTLLNWFDARLSGKGWKKKTNSVLFQLLHLQGVGVYMKDMSADTEATITVMPVDSHLLVYYGVGPKAPPFPDIVPVYPSADELIRNQDADEQTAIYIGYTLDPRMNVFNWYQGQLAKYSWTEIRVEDQDADLIRIYQRPVGNQIFSLKLVVGSIDPNDQLSNYNTGILVMYGPSDRPEFQPGADADPSLYLFQPPPSSEAP